MKNAFYLTLLVIFAISLFVFTSCERSHMTETEVICTPEQGRMAKKGDWHGDCFGYACYSATNDSIYIDATLTKIPDDDFQTGSIDDNCIVEWDDHAAYVRTGGVNKVTMKVTVDEFIHPDIHYANVYDIGEDHSILGGAWVGWVKEKEAPPPPPPPDPVYVIITGPIHLDWDEEGEFVANAYLGYMPYSNYQWWWRLPEGKSGGGGKGPPPGEWQYLFGLEGEKTIEWGYERSFELKVKVWDDENNTAEDTHSVTVFDK